MWRSVSHCALVVERWLNRVEEDASGLTFEEWNPTQEADVSQPPVAILIKLSKLRAAGFTLREKKRRECYKCNVCIISPRFVSKPTISRTACRQMNSVFRQKSPICLRKSSTCHRMSPPCLEIWLPVVE